MTTNLETLAELLVADLPPSFVSRLLEALPKIYVSALERVQEIEPLGEEEVNYLLGHMRRVLFEAEFRSIASDCGLRLEMHQPEKGGCSHVRVITGRFQLIGCHVQSPGSFPRHSDCREQYSAVNECISQQEMFPAGSQPGEHSLYGILTHAAEPKDNSAFRSAQIGFPDVEFIEWVEEPVDLLDVQDNQRLRYQAVEDLQAQVQDPMPKWKSQDASHDKDAQSDKGDIA